MSQVEEIEQAIGQLPDAEFRRLAQWILERDNVLWDKQMDADSVSGKLDALFAEADGPTLPWPGEE